MVPDALDVSSSAPVAQSNPRRVTWLWPFGDIARPEMGSQCGEGAPALWDDFNKPQLSKTDVAVKVAVRERQTER